MTWGWWEPHRKGVGSRDGDGRRLLWLPQSGTTAWSPGGEDAPGEILMRFSDRETVGPERVFWRQFCSVSQVFTEGLQPAKPEQCEAPDVTRNVIVNDALSSRRVRSWRRGGRTRRSERTSLAWEGPRERGRGPSPGGPGEGETWASRGHAFCRSVSPAVVGI